MTPQEIVDIINSPQRSDGTVFYALKEYLDEYKYNEALLCIQNNFDCNQDEAKEALALCQEQIYDKIKKAAVPLTPEQIAYNNAVAREWQNKPQCPTCQSTNLKKITATSKLVNTAVWGIFGTKRHKTFHCNNCGYEW